ncbi:glycerate kinase family protein [Staphylococcus chromogenes]|uniref:glycerate kinase family protein n=1 Tax=Staphylococcus chromogenes TaxID=46126 RepID=UPI000D02BB38|nr:glycerate kinase [Staphylococcus chromogenes]
MKRLLIAPDSFKESMTALEAANAIESGFQQVFGNEIECIKIPMADGGEGTTQSLHDALQGRWRTVTVTDPLGRPIQATYSIANEGKSAVIEMASASGLGLIARDERNPLKTTTFGTGELVLDALNQGVTHIILGIGGSATNDGGAGFIQALGGRLLDKQGQDLPFGGAALAQLATIDLTHFDPRLKEITFEVACDVDNPLLGESGATRIYGPQKGALAEDIQILESAMFHYNEVIQRELHQYIAHEPGAGAAGGLGAALLATINVQLRPGIDIVLEMTRFKHHVLNCDLVITGEGKIDAQTIYGKTPIGIAKVAQSYHKPVIAVAGMLGEGYEAVYDYGIEAVFSLVPGPISLETALNEGPQHLERLAYNIAKVYKMQI